WSAWSGAPRSRKRLSEPRALAREERLPRSSTLAARTVTETDFVARTGDRDALVVFASGLESRLLSWSTSTPSARAAGAAKHHSRRSLNARLHVPLRGPVAGSRHPVRP